MTTTQQQFLDDLKVQISQYVYRSIERCNDDLIAFLQYASGINNLNWQDPDAKAKLASVFTKYAEEITAYGLADGDFRTYCLLKLVNIICDVYDQELVRLYLSANYNMSPESVVGALTVPYSVQAPQNTNFPDKTNTSDILNPSPTNIVLVPKSLYGSDSLD